jgi:hypothetical protein
MLTAGTAAAEPSARPTQPAHPAQAAGAAAAAAASASSIPVTLGDDNCATTPRPLQPA